MSKQEKFVPMKLQEVLQVDVGNDKVTVTTTIKGIAAQEFEEMRKKAGLNRSQLLTQMVYHCLGRSKDLKDFYRRLAVLVESNEN